MSTEAKARILINDLLHEAGWRFFDDETGPANVTLETHVKVKKKALDALGDDFEKTARGFVDYLLLDDRGFPVAVLEAKSEKHDPLIGKEQARKYARSQNARFVLLSNGRLHYFWDLEQGNPQLITGFPTPESLGHFREFKPNPDSLVREQVEADYVAVTQNPNYGSDPRWTDPAQREAYMKDAELKFLRPYQLRAIEALQDAVGRGQSRFLFHPREVFADVIADRAAAVILAHNHPSGELQPSEADLRTHEQLTEAGQILGLRILDHIIVSRKGYFSFQEASLLKD
jgi:type I restriction enzyme R subunit